MFDKMAIWKNPIRLQSSTRRQTKLPSCSLLELGIISISLRLFLKMASPSESYTALDQKKVIQEELRRGNEAATLLGSRLQDAEVSPLVEQVMGSFSRSLCLLDAANPMVFGSPSSDDVRSETNSPGKRKVSEEYVRGGYRKRTPASTWSQFTSKTPADGYKWRKYGQKEIKGYKHPRSYFYCYHKGDQGCKAARQVQKTNEDTTTFVITYLHKHTCKPVLAPRNLISQSTSLKEDSLISFGSSAYNTTTTQDAPQLSSSFPAAEVLSNLALGSPRSEYTAMMPNLEAFEVSMLRSQIAGTASDYGDFNVGRYEGSTSGAQTMGSLLDYGDAMPDLKSSFSSLDSLMASDPFDSYMDEVTVQKDYDEMFSFDDGEFSHSHYKDAGDRCPFF